MTTNPGFAGAAYGYAQVGPYNGGQAEYPRVWAKSSFLVSHKLSLYDAADVYKHFDAREDGWTKAILKPGQST